MGKIAGIDLGDFPLLLAPMEEVSDPPFRAICKELGADMVYTEFIPSEGLIRHVERSLKKLTLYEEERPIGVQIFGHRIESMRQAASIAEAAGPDLIDINYGCPVKKIASKGAGAGILLDLPKMQKMTEEIVKQVSLPVTVKTRLGWDADHIRIVEVAQRLQDAGIQALTIHGRTRAQMYRGEADWEPIAKVKADPSIRIPIFGNGDIDSPSKAVTYQKKYGVDGVMIGRAAIRHPWLFREIKHYRATGQLLPPPTVAERLALLRRHFTHSLAWKGERRGVLEMRRYYPCYLRTLSIPKVWRLALMQTQERNEILSLLDKIEQHLLSPK